ncbi:hypothetical protein [Actinomadura kijaniata]|uniref:hypothetical protein n=1 Tax=Actinomadura kijaniata TaxID=46161 RepID=UPI000A053855|nr:hypothetical protein [Actinomadura kijaniata]
MNAQGTAVGPCWNAARRWAGYAAASSMGTYLAVKVVWVVAGLLGERPDGFGGTGWVLLNAVTVAMAAAGVALGLALARPWGSGLPAVPVVFVAWTGAGLLVPMIPLMAVRGVLGGGDGETGATPSWEALPLTVGFAGMGLGLAVALPIYLRERWPRAFRGRVGDLRLPVPPATAAVSGAVALGALWCHRAAGGTLGLVRDLDVDGRLLIANSGLWALLGAGSIATLARASRAPRWIPVATAFVASGSLFAWSAWKLPMVILRPGGFTTAEHPWVAVAEHTLGITTGLTLLAVVLRAVRHPSGRPTEGAGPSRAR